MREKERESERVRKETASSKKIKNCQKLFVHKNGTVFTFFVSACCFFTFTLHRPQDGDTDADDDDFVDADDDDFADADVNFLSVKKNTEDTIFSVTER